jgi:hypothetical protein
MGRDKKNRGRVRRMVVLQDLGKPVILEDLDPALMEEAYQAVSAVHGAQPYPAASGQGIQLENPWGQSLYIPPIEDSAEMGEGA